MIPHRQICGLGDVTGRVDFSAPGTSGTTQSMRARPSRAPLLVLLIALLGLFGSTSRVHAHADLDEAKKLASELELEAALGAFDRALASGTLTRAELVELLSERAFVFHALHRKNELVQDFIWLSALNPDHRLDLRAPPDLTAIWTSVRDQGRGQLKVQLEAGANQDGLSARANLGGTVPDGVRTQIGRRRTGGKWELLEGPDLREPQKEDTTVALYAQAIGLGSVVVATSYSADKPLFVTMSPSGVALPVAEAPPSDSEPSWLRKNRGWVIGAAAVVVTAVVVGTVLAVKSREDNSDETNLKPMVSF